MSIARFSVLSARQQTGGFPSASVISLTTHMSASEEVMAGQKDWDGREAAGPRTECLAAARIVCGYETVVTVRPKAATVD